MDATYVILCFIWLQILESHIPSMKQHVPKESQMLTTPCQLPHSYTYFRAWISIKSEHSDDPQIHHYQLYVH